MKISIGTTPEGERIWLTNRDLSTHAHAVGSSQHGKSKLLEWLCRELIKQGHGFCLIDPHGKLYDNLVQWLAHVEPNREIVLFNPSYEKRVVGFNPFKLDGALDESRLWTKVDRMVAATLRAWGQTDADKAPRLDRWLRTLYYTLIEQGLSIDAARYFLTYEHKAVRDSIISHIGSPAIREDWMNLLSSASKRGFVGRLESAGNRLQRFVTHPTVRRTMGLTTNNIDLQAIMNDQKVLLVNLQPSDALSEDAARVIGTLLLNESWEIIRRRNITRGQKLPDFYLIVDEFQNFATPDVPDMLDQAAKYGLHLLLSHQRLSQLSSDLQGAVRNAQTRLVFGGLPKREVQEMLEGAPPSVVATLDDETGDAERTMAHAKRHFTLRRPGKALTMVVAPFVEDRPSPSDKVQQYTEGLVAGFLTLEEVDSLLAHGIDREPQVIQSDSQKKRLRQRTEPHLFTESRTAVTVEANSARKLSTQRRIEPSVEERHTAIVPATLGRGGKQHKYLQQLVKRWAEEKGYRTTIERPILGGKGSVDVVLERAETSIACEISVTTTVEHEIANIEKCLASDFTHVVFITPEKKILKKAQKLLADALGRASAERVHTFAPEEFLVFLEELDEISKAKEETVRGYKVRVKYRPTTKSEQKARKDLIAQTVLQGLRRVKDKS